MLSLRSDNGIVYAHYIFSHLVRLMAEVSFIMMKKPQVNQLVKEKPETTTTVTGDFKNFDRDELTSGGSRRATAAVQVWADSWCIAQLARFAGISSQTL